jgi:hypothetical protein
LFVVWANGTLRFANLNEFGKVGVLDVQQIFLTVLNLLPKAPIWMTVQLKVGVANLGELGSAVRQKRCCRRARSALIGRFILWVTLLLLLVVGLGGGGV